MFNIIIISIYCSFIITIFIIVNFIFFFGRRSCGVLPEDKKSRELRGKVEANILKHLDSFEKEFQKLKETQFLSKEDLSKAIKKLAEGIVKKATGEKSSSTNEKSLDNNKKTMDDIKNRLYKSLIGLLKEPKSGDLEIQVIDEEDGRDNNSCDPHPCHKQAVCLALGVYYKCTCPVGQMPTKKDKKNLYNKDSDKDACEDIKYSYNKEIDRVGVRNKTKKRFVGTIKGNIQRLM